MKICIAGIGNPIRSDDGIGAYVCEQIELLQIPGITTMALQQLQVEQIEVFAGFDHVVIVDASVNSSEVEFYPLKKEDDTTGATSHHLNPVIINSLSDILNQVQLSIQICSVKGIDFDYGEGLSPTALQNADTAVQIITNWIYRL